MTAASQDCGLRRVEFANMCEHETKFKLKQAASDHASMLMPASPATDKLAPERNEETRKSRYDVTVL